MIALALQIGAAFNLVCVGTQTDYTSSESPMRLVLRIDLDQRRFCFDDCESTLAIASVSDTEIILQDEPMQGPWRARILRRVNRESGAYYASVGTDQIYIRGHGTCETAPFTGFPARRF